MDPIELGTDEEAYMADVVEPSLLHMCHTIV